MVLDHGVLNVPLAKRGNIDAQIDRFKREQAAERRNADAASFHNVRAKKARVRHLLINIGDWRILQIAKPLGCRKASAARAKLASMANSNLDGWIVSLEREQFPAGGCAKCWAPVGKCDHSSREWIGNA